METQVCTKCGQTKPVDAFSLVHSFTRVRLRRCRDCIRRMQQIRQEAKKQQEQDDKAFAEQCRRESAERTVWGIDR